MTKRLLAVQGPMQLIAGYLAMEWYKQIGGQGSDESKPVLLLYDFLAPEEVEPEFVEIILQLASIREWDSVIFIGCKEMRKIMWRRYANSKDKLAKIIGQDEFDEIYLARDHCGHGSALIINAYKTAKRITYGDSLGWVENDPAFSRFNWQSPATSLLSMCKAYLRKHFLGGPERLPFDAAVLTLPIVCSKGYLAGLPLFVPKKEFVTDALKSMYQKLVDTTDLGSYCNALTASANGKICYLFLLSNLHRSGMMTLENEIRLYREIIHETAAKGSHILLKAHPRGSHKVLKALVDQLRPEYETIAVDDVALSRIPIELWRGLIERCVVIPVFSASAVHLKYVYGTVVQLPLRTELVRKYFFRNRVARMLNANYIISQSVENLKTWDGNSLLFESRHQDSWVPLDADELSKT
jgi:hypothetical protein